MFEIKVKIITKSNCLIGNQTESFSVGGVDQATTVDEKARPIIQGSAFKGALRNIVREHGDEMPNTKNYVTVILQRLLEKYQRIPKIEENKKIKKMMENIKNYCENPKAEYIFGVEGLNNMPRLFCSDFCVIDKRNSEEYFAIETKNSLEEKEREIISRPRTYRIVRPGVIFEGRLRFQDPYFTQEEEDLDEVKKELIQAIKFFNSGFYGIGNSKSRGYGMIEVEIL